MTIEITHPAKKDLLRMDSKNRERILTALMNMRDFPAVSGLVKIEGKVDRWRLRVGDFRIILRIDQGEGIIYALRVMHRREAYR